MSGQADITDLVSTDSCSHSPHLHPAHPCLCLPTEDRQLSSRTLKMHLNELSFSDTKLYSKHLNDNQVVKGIYLVTDSCTEAFHAAVVDQIPLTTWLSFKCLLCNLVSERGNLFRCILRVLLASCITA